MGGQQSQALVVDETTKMVSTVLTNISLNCTSVSNSLQTTKITCNPNLDSGTQYFEQNSACTSCYNNLKDFWLDKYALARSKGKKLKADLNEELQAIINSAIACKSVCKACIVNNISQDTLVKNILSCKSYNTIKNTIQNKLNTAITQKLKNNQDVFSAALSIFGNSASNVVNTLNNRINSKLTQNVLSDIQQNINANQNIDITENSTAVSGLSQNSIFQASQTYLTRNKIFNDILSQSEWKQFQQAINDQNTTETLANAVVNVSGTLTKLVRSTMGKVVIAVVSLVGVLFLAVSIYAIYLYARHRQKQKALKSGGIQYNNKSNMPYRQTMYRT